MINHNGQLVDTPQLTAQNRGLSYGDAVFETMRVQGSKIFFWEDHYFRLMASMRILRMDIPMDFTPEDLEQEILKTVKATNIGSSTCSVRLTVYRNDGGKYLPADNAVSFLITASPLEDAFYMLREEAYVVELYKDHYLNPDLLSTLKTANKILNVTGSIFAKENGYDNCLLLNTNKMVVEALQGNLFLVTENKIKTPPLEDGCLRGIIRKQLIDIIGKLDDYILEEASISPFELQKADELFITNSLMGIQPITKYRKKSYSNTVAKDLLGKLNTKARLG